MRRGPMQNALLHVWHCTNSECRATRSLPPRPVNGAPVACACGAPMKRDYKPPVLRYLDFLREPDEPSMQAESVRTNRED